MHLSCSLADSFIVHGFIYVVRETIAEVHQPAGHAPNQISMSLTESIFEVS